MRLVSVSPVLLVALSTVNHVASFTPLPLYAKSPASIRSLTKSIHTTKSMISAQTHDNEDSLLLGGATDIPSVKKSTDPKSILELFAQDVLKNAKATMILAVMMLAMAPLPSNAVMSGGRIGGSISSPSRTSISPSRSRSYSPSRGYGGGYGGGYGPSVSGFASGYASGLGAGYLSAPRIGFSPFVSPYYARPYYGGAGIISYNPWPSLGQLVFFGGLALALSSALRKDTVEWGLPSSFDLDSTASPLGPGTSFVKISVALDVANRDDPSSILSVLTRLGQTSNTDSRRGIQNLTSQVALEVLRRKSSIISASTEYQHFKSRSQALREFNNQATKERSKFERENTRAYQVTEAGSKATMAVVTLVLSIDGDSTKVPRITSIEDVEESLRKIASDSKMDDCLQSVEILWTPEERSETLTLKDVIADYPTLRSV